MQDSHTTVSEGDTAADASTLGLTSATALGLPEHLAGRPTSAWLRSSRT